MTDDTAQALLDDLLKRLHRLFHEHPLCRAVPPPEALHVRIGDDYWHRIMVAQSELNTRVIERPPNPKLVTPLPWRCPWGTVYFRVTKSLPLDEMELVLVPEQVFAPIGLDDAEPPTVVTPRTWGLRARYRVRCVPQKEDGNVTYEDPRPIVLMVFHEDAVRIRLNNNIALVADRCDVERGSSAWGRMMRSFASRQMCL